MLYDSSRLSTKMATSPNEVRSFVTKNGAWIAEKREFNTLAIVDDKNSKVVADMTIAQGIHVVKERKIAEYTKVQSMRRCK